MTKEITTEKIILKYYPKKENILPAMKDISASFGFISLSDAEKLAEYFSLPLAKIYETASFYDQIKVRKQPDMVIRVCSGTNCATKDAFRIVKEIENLFRIKSDSESDPKMRLEVISCLGRCGEGPVVVINGNVYTRVTAAMLRGILEEYIR